MVDPTVGTDRRAIAVEVGGGSSVLVGPDNGLLAPAVGLVGGATRVVELHNEQYRLGGDACTFDGRDVFGPAAAHLAAGVALSDLGPLVDPAGLVPGIVANAAVHPDSVEAEVLWVDHYGNAQLNVGPHDLGHLEDPMTLRAADGRRTVRRAATYAAIGSGEVGIVVDSYGLVSLALDRRSCAAELSLEVGSAVTLSRHEGDDGAGAAGGGGTVAVRLGDRTGGTR